MRNINTCDKKKETQSKKKVYCNNCGHVTECDLFEMEAGKIRSLAAFLFVSASDVIEREVQVRLLFLLQHPPLTGMEVLSDEMDIFDFWGRLSFPAWSFFSRSLVLNISVFLSTNAEKRLSTLSAWSACRLVTIRSR